MQLKLKTMILNYLQELKHDTILKKVTTPRGVEIPIKIHKGWRFVNYKGLKIGLSKIPKKVIIKCFDDFMVEYITTDWHIKYPCKAINHIINLKMKKK